MQNFRTYLCSSIGKKQIVAITGIVWCGFVLMHMAGNCLLFLGADTYNKYSHALVSKPALYLAEAFLVGALLVHVFFATSMTLDGRKARSTPPDKSPSNPLKGGSFASRTMILTGLTVFGFIVWHLITFKYGPHYTTNVDGTEMRDLYKLIVETFTSPVYVFAYLGLLVILGLHLSHGVAALFQTLGLASVRNCCIKKIGYAFTALVILGFMSQPLYFFLKGGNG